MRTILCDLMTEQPKPTKKERRDAARAERIAAEEQQAAVSARKKRLGIFGGLLVGALVIVAIAVLVSSSGDDKKTSSGELADVDQVLKLYDGIDQKGITLGDKAAPATIVVFADVQCPFCRDFEISELPEVVEKSVRTGKAKVTLRLRAFLGEDSLTGANALNAAGLQDKMFETTGILYHNQGEENSGWVTDEYVRDLLGSVPGLDVDKALKDADGPEVEKLLGEAETLATRYGSSSTPDVYVGTSENDANKVDATAAAINKAVDEIAN